MNQNRKNVRSTKAIPTQLKISNTTALRGKKMRNMYTKVYNVCNTIFSDQTGQFPQQPRRGNKYIMVMVEINSNAIFVKFINIHNEAKLTQA